MPFEFPLVMATVAFVVGLTGPGRDSLDYALNIALPEPVTYLVVLVLMLIVVGITFVATPSQERRQTPAG